MTYSLSLFDSDDMPEVERRAAERRFRQALENALGDAALVLPMQRAFERIVATYGEAPEPDSLSEPERAVFEQWLRAEQAAVAAAFGTNRYMGDAMYQIGDDPGTCATTRRGPGVTADPEET